MIYRSSAFWWAYILVRRKTMIDFINTQTSYKFFKEITMTWINKVTVIEGLYIRLEASCKPAHQSASLVLGLLQQTQKHFPASLTTFNELPIMW